MSKNSKLSMGYTDKPVLAICSNCKNFASEMVLAPWMVERNNSGEGVYFENDAKYTVEKHGIEKNLRCTVGGFAVKKMGSCETGFTPKEAQS